MSRIWRVWRTDEPTGGAWYPLKGDAIAAARVERASVPWPYEIRVTEESVPTGGLRTLLCDALNGDLLLEQCGDVYSRAGPKRPAVAETPEPRFGFREDGKWGQLPW